MSTLSMRVSARPNPTGRIFLYIATASRAAAGPAATLSPLIDQMNLDALKIADWRKDPGLIVRCTPARRSPK